MASDKELILELEARIHRLSAAGDDLRLQAEADATGETLAEAIATWDKVFEADGDPALVTSMCDRCFTVTRLNDPCPHCHA